MPSTSKKFGSGGRTRPDVQKVNKSKTDHGKMTFFKEGGDTMAKMNAGMMAIMAKRKDGMHKMSDGKMMKDSAMKKGGMAGGGMPMKNGKPAFIGDGKGMKKGGMTFNDDREPGSSGGTQGDRVPSGQGEKRGGLMKTKKMANGGSASRRADGVATKGKTKGSMVKMNMGGKAC